MRSTRAILSVQYTAASSKAGKAVGGFLRYVHYRDHQNRERDEKGVSGLVRYVAFRDSASPQGRLFNQDQTIGDPERRALLRHVRRSIVGVPRTSRSARAVYRFVLSPEDARGLDLRRLARDMMSQLERDSGGPLPPWLAAEHRNTAHPHVHIVMAARLEVEPGRFQELRITKVRLARMKQALGREMERQRGERTAESPLDRRLLEGCRQPLESGRRGVTRETVRQRLAVHDPLRRVTRRSSSRLGFQRVLARMAAHYRWEAEQLAEEQRRRLEHGREMERERSR